LRAPTVRGSTAKFCGPMGALPEQSLHFHSIHKKGENQS